MMYRKSEKTDSEGRRLIKGILEMNERQSHN